MSKMSKKTESFAGMKKEGKFASLSMEDVRRAGFEAGMALKRRPLDLADRKSRIEAANSLKQRATVLWGMGDEDEVWPLLMGVKALEREV